ncbi:phosphoribosylaminoimidazole carboxylase [Artemisia annua]|uniref:phosphoribosylaminoimidazole carboxylase n=1 Tax=Artemisia annua TaxID=35608 RepID=A0A2U1PZT6_ARTAN|nr:phosphoribosylaminoimidazole carboxylase [Artemisia annua]
MLSPSSHQVGFTSAFSSTRSSLVRFGTFQKLSSTSISSFSSSCPMINQQSARSIACSASIERDVSQRKEDVPAPHGLSDKIVGVLGGGQLGRMLCQAASQMAIKVNILDPLENCPASSISHYHMVGSFDDSATVEEFAKRCEILTVEIEHVDADTLEKLEKQGVDCQPKASTIRIIQDKFLQKVHFSGHDIPLPRFKQVSLGGFGHGLYVEQWAPFVKELAVIVARGRDNSILCYPAVETVHRDNICHIVKAPANESWKIMKLATDIASRAVSSLEGAGVFAVELFLTGDGEILLNEVAPRPHNSGHHTIESCYTSQYEQHLRAVVGLPLGDPSMKAPASMMYNILGEDEGEAGFIIANQIIKRALCTPGATVHWYDKPDMRKQRKMGHITVVGPSMGIVETRVKSFLKEGSAEDIPVAPRVGIIMGSDSDLPVMKEAAKVLDDFGVSAEVRIVSAHRTPELMYSYATSARERGIQVIIAGAGGAAHLPGMVAALTPLPVIGVPVRASALDGLDSLLSIVQMPRGVPVATVAINNATNAGLLAVRMLGVADTALQARMAQFQEDARDTVLEKTKKLEKVGWEEYLSS